MENPTDKQLARVLDEEIVAMDAMLTALQAEHEALESRDPDALARASLHKLACIDAVSTAGRERCKAVDATSAAHTTDGMQARWQTLARLARSCKEKNEINGMLIRWQHRYIEQTLTVLGHNSAEARLYGPDGASDRIGLLRSPRGIA